MKTLALYDAKNRLSEVCDLIASSHEPVVITRRGKAIVQIIPIESSSGSDIWSTVKESRAKYGNLTDEFKLPERTAKKNRPDPLE